MSNKAIKNAPECAKSSDQRQAIGGLLQKLVYAAIEQKGNVETWWARCEQDHRNEWNEDSSPGTGMTPMHVPFTQPRVDMITAQVCSVIGTQDPYMLADGIASDADEDRLERTLHKFWKVAKFEKKLRQASHICVDTNRVWWRVAWEMDARKPFAGILLDVIHPRNVCLFPCTLAGIEGARCLGHRFYRRQRDVVAMQKAGAYFDDRPPTYGDTPQEYDRSGEIASAGAAPGATGPDPGDMLVEMWDLLVKYADPDRPEEKECWYRATLAFKQSLLLSFEPYPYSRPWYFDAAYITGNEEAYWSAISISRHLSGLQDATDKMTAGVYNASLMAAFPPILGPELPQKDARYGPGDFIPTDLPAQSYYSPTIRANTQGMMASVEGFDAVGNKTARVSDGMQAVAQPKETTATENAQIAAGASTGMAEYIANFSEPLPDMASFTCELLLTHVNDWQQYYAAVLGITPQTLEAPVLWETNGSTPGSTPGAKLAAIQKLTQMLQAFGPQTGLDPYTLTQVAIANMGMTGVDNLQIDKEQLLARQQLAAAQPQAAHGGLPSPAGAGPLPPSGIQVPGGVPFGPAAGAAGPALPPPPAQ